MQLPDRPNLRHLSHQAKKLLHAHRAGDASVADRIKPHLPRLSRKSPQAILAADLTLQEAQHVLAVEYGFSGWKTLADYVNARLLSDRWSLSERVGTEISRATSQAFKRAGPEVHQTETVVEIPVDVEFEIEEPGRRSQVKVEKITRIPLWDTPEQRESGIEYDDDTHISADLSGDDNTDWTSMPNRELWEWSNQIDDEALKRACEPFARQAATALTEAAGIDVRIPHWSRSYTETVDFIRMLDQAPAHIYRFGMRPTKGLAALTLPAALAASFLGQPYDRENPRTDLAPQKRRRLRQILARVLQALAGNWRSFARIECADLTPCDNPKDLGIALYEERIMTLAFLVQSARASRFLHLCLPRTVLVPLLPRREES